MATIRSLQHPNVKRLYRIRKEEEGEVCLIYSAKILQEIGQKGVIQELWVPEGHSPPKELRPQKIVMTTEEVIRKVSGLKSASDIVGVMERPKEAKELRGQRLLLLDRIGDPGNLGTLLRTALALGWEGVYLTNGSVSPFNDKALRAMRGALFHLPYQIGSMEEALQRLPNHALLVADPRGEAITNLSPKYPLLLALGNEAHGPSSFLLKEGTPIAIPISPKMESLNVAIAGGILLYTLGAYGD